MKIEKINLKKYYAERKERAATPFFICEGFTLISKEEQKELFAAYREKDTLDVVFSIEGIDFPFEKTLDAIFKAFENMVEERAKEMCKERLYKIDDLFRRLKEECSRDFIPKEESFDEM